ncbi:MAG: aspartyl protease family protein [Patescibacteria group bacterium]
MKFRYKKFGSTLRPVIPIKVSAPNNPEGFGYEVLVDSGADLCIFHAEIGEALGIQVRKGKAQEVFGIGGKASVYYLHKVTIVVGGWSYQIETGFMPSVAGNVMQYGVVGQKGFFDLFTVKFDLLKSEVELKERK